MQQQELQGNWGQYQPVLRGYVVPEWEIAVREGYVGYVLRTGTMFPVIAGIPVTIKHPNDVWYLSYGHYQCMHLVTTLFAFDHVGKHPSSLAATVESLVLLPPSFIA
jgi:hypothetical protein